VVYINYHEYIKNKSFGFLDVIGVVKSTSDMQTIVSKASQKEFNKRELLLVDEKASITVTLWGQQVQIIVIKSDRLIFFS
jgi:replication factor A1